MSNEQHDANSQAGEVRSSDQLEPSAYRHFGGMCWPVPGERMNELARALTFAPEGHAFTMSERLVIRSFLDAYRELVSLPKRQRDMRVRELRQGPGSGGL
mgnify:CR=1 FL=1